MVGYPQEKQPGGQIYSQPSGQMYSQPGVQTYSQSGVQTYTQLGVQTYSQPEIQPYARQQTPKPTWLLPMHFHQMIYMISISVLVLGVISIIFGGVSFAINGYSIRTHTGVNIWAGVMVSKLIIIIQLL